MFSRYLLNFSTNKLKASYQDVVIVGTGIAGLSATLQIASTLKTLLVTKGDFAESTSYEAQGGVAVALSSLDSFERHTKDTLEAGDGLGSEEVARVVAQEGIERVKELIEIGVRFDRLNGEFDYSLEGGHSLPRILHQADRTGQTIIESLRKKVQSFKSLEIREETMLVDVLTLSNQVVGVLLLLPNGELEVAWTKAIVLATGGVGEVYAYTTNPAVATGDGIAVAFRAGASVTDMEFIQFHPTALNQKGHQRLLLTEALRGEGAYLVNTKSERIMGRVHPQRELAPRFVVVRRMMEELKKGNKVFLDCRHLDSRMIKTKFSYIWKKLREIGLNPSEDLIPVSPAAHFCIGGVRTDLWGKTEIKGLYACGEVAATYLHGANRLASNSLLEGLVFGWRVGKAIKNSLKSGFTSFESTKDLKIEFEGRKKKAVSFGISELKSQLGKLMMEKSGIVREESRLEELLNFLKKEKGFLERGDITRNFLELANLWTVAWLIGKGAKERKESRGVHFREDFPEKDDDSFLGHFVWRRKKDAIELEFHRKNC